VAVAVAGSAAVVIDLGELDQPTPAPARRPILTRPGQRLRAVIVVVVTCLAGLGSSGPAAPYLGSPLWTAKVSLAGFSVGTHNAYVSEPGAQEVSGRRLDSGRVLWRVPLQGILDATIDVGAGLAAVVTHQPNGPLEMTMVDDASGRVLYHRDGGPLGHIIDGVLLVDAYPQNCPDVYPCDTLWAIDPHTGAELWARPSSADGHVLVDLDEQGDVHGLAAVASDGSASSLDPVTGAVIEQSEPGVASLYAPGVLMNGMIIAGGTAAGRVTISARSLRAPQRQWSTDLPAPLIINALTEGFGLFRCGGLLCVGVGAGTVVLDPNTGKMLFNTDGAIVGWTGSGPITALYDGSSATPTTVTTVDLRTGRIATTTASAAVPWERSAGRAMLLWESHRQTAFTVLDAHGVPHPLGSVDGAALNCQATGPLLACADPLGTLRVWRIPRLPG
jgi:outer membrane protein assembly factor BamB